MVNRTALKEHFPMLRDRNEILQEIRNSYKLSQMYETWNLERREEFLDFCTGIRGMKVLYDSFFKEALNCEYDVSRLEFFLCTVLKKKVKIVRIMPNDSTRIADETSLLITDIVVELEDGSLANVEIQKIGYAFPGARCACYSADMLLRQYKRVRAVQGDAFSYHNIKNVYLIVIYEKSPTEFKALPDIYYHHAKQVFDTGLEMELLQEYVMISLDFFKKCMQNKAIETELEAWLMFLSSDDPERIIELVTAHPEFKAMYESLYSMCLNTERVMEMFSEELQKLDRNTVQYMIDEQQKQIDAQEQKLYEQMERLTEQRQRLSEQDQQLTEQMQRLTEQNEQLSVQGQQLTEQMQRLTEQTQRLSEQDRQLTEQTQRLTEQDQQLTEQTQRLAEQDQQLSEQTQRLTEQDQLLLEKDAQIAELLKKLETLEK